MSTLAKLRHSLTRRPIVPLLLVFLLPLAHAQTPTGPHAGSLGGRVVLVLPFDNRSGQPNLGWIGDSFPDTVSQRLSSAGFLTIGRDDRVYALEHLGLPADFRPTRATTIRIAQTLDADFVVVGSYTIANGRIQVQAQVLEVNALRLSAPLNDSSELTRLFDVENAIAWKVARQIDSHFNVALQTFLAASSGVRLSAFEDYIRGTGSAPAPERIKRLQQAVQETPNYPAALLALGKAEYAQGDYERAAAALSKVPHSDRLSLEASFYLGLARFNDGKYAEAESAFVFVAQRLPLPEVVNNQGVSSSRQGRNAIPLFQRASTADPGDPDYHYNLAVAMFRTGDFAGAKREVDKTLSLRSSDSEAATLRDRIARGRAIQPVVKSGASASEDEFQPLERIRRTYSEASFRQAAFQLDQIRLMKMATLPPAEQATQYSQLGRDYLAQGLVPEAERQFQAAIAADPANPAAHVGLAQVREQSGSPAEARTEAETSLKLKPNAAAHLVLARLELQQKQLVASATDVGAALKLEPGNTAAQGMRMALQARGQSIP